MHIIINKVDFFSQLGNRPSQQDCLAPTEPTDNASFLLSVMGWVAEIMVRSQAVLSVRCLNGKCRIGTAGI